MANKKFVLDLSGLKSSGRGTIKIGQKTIKAHPDDWDIDVLDAIAAIGGWDLENMSSGESSEFYGLVADIEPGNVYDVTLIIKGDKPPKFLLAPR